MKIIGENNTGFIVQASKTEFANLIGYYCISDAKHLDLKVDDEIQIL